MNSSPYSFSHIAVYTAIFGGYDTLITEAPAEPRVDYYCFTDDPAMETGYYQRVVVPMEAGLWPKAMNLKIRACGHPVLEAYDVTLYHDGSNSIREGTSVRSLVDEHLVGETFWKMYAHPLRSSLRHEALAIMKTRKDTFWRTAKTIPLLAWQGYTLNPPTLSMTTIILRRVHDERSQRLGREWCHAYLRFPVRRDQMTFDTVCAKLGLQVDYFAGNVFDNPYFHWHTKHNPPRKRYGIPGELALANGVNFCQRLAISCLFHVCGRGQATSSEQLSVNGCQLSGKNNNPEPGT